jgi:dTDP-4-amino-4,6-dideoxygalactose transaminase
MILCSNPHAQYLSHRDEIDAAVARVLGNGRYILGAEVDEFEKEFASYIGVSHGIGVGSGTEAIHLALVACGIGVGDEVITTAHTAVATVSAIELAGATPVFVDIEPGYYTLAPSKLEAMVTPRTKAVIPVHIYGLPADLTPILEIARKHGFYVIEDCAQAHGATYFGQRVGAWGDIACFSFYPTKNLGAIGDGGMVVTNNPGLAERARLLREYGWASRYVSHLRGWNSRLDEIQAAVLRVKLCHLEEDNARRAHIASLYKAGLADTGLILPVDRPNSNHVYHLYVVRSGQRDNLQKFLKEKGIGALIHYPVPVHLQPAYLGRLSGGDNLSHTEQASQEVLSLPIYPELTSMEQQSVIDAVSQFK